MIHGILWLYLLVVFLGLVVAIGELRHAMWAARELRRLKRNGLRQMSADHFVRSNWIIVFVMACFLSISVIPHLNWPDETRRNTLITLFMSASLALTAKSLMNRFDRLLLSQLAEAAILAEEAAQKEKPCESSS